MNFLDAVAWLYGIMFLVLRWAVLGVGFFFLYPLRLIAECADWMKRNDR